MLKQLQKIFGYRASSLPLSPLRAADPGIARRLQIVKAYESSTATLRALLAHPSLERDAVERTFDALADANTDARELDDAVRSGMDLAVGASAPPEDEDEINAELAALVAEADAEAAVREKVKTQCTAPPEVSPVRDTRKAQQAQGRTHTDVLTEAETVAQPVLA